MKVSLEPDEWIKDSGCSRHMTGKKSLFSTYQEYDGGNVTFCSKLKRKIIRKGTISHEYLSIDDVAHVENLGFNLLSISQLFRKKYKVLFSENESKILKDGITIAKGVLKNNIYVMKLIKHLEINFALPHWMSPRLFGIDD